MKNSPHPEEAGHQPADGAGDEAGGPQDHPRCDHLQENMVDKHKIKIFLQN